MIPTQLLAIFALFGVGGSLLIAGIAAQMTTLVYSSAAISSAGLLLSIHLCMRERWTPPTFEPPVFTQRIYRDPGMKKNKSDTNLELMGAPKNTQDDGTPPTDCLRIVV